MAGFLGSAVAFWHLGQPAPPWATQEFISKPNKKGEEIRKRKNNFIVKNTLTRPV